MFKNYLEYIQGDIINTYERHVQPEKLIWVTIREKHIVI